MVKFNNQNIPKLSFILEYFNSILGLKFKILILLLLTSTLFEMIGLASAVTIINDDFQISGNINVSGIWIASFLDIKEMSGLSILIIIFSLFCLKGLFLFLGLVFSGHIRSELLFTKRLKLCNSLLKINSAEINNISRGNFINIFSEQSVKLVSCFHSLVFFIIKLFTVLIYLITISWSNFHLAFLIFILTFFLFFLFRGVTKKVASASFELSTNSSQLMDIMAMAYDNLLELKLGKRKKYFDKKIDFHNNEIKNNFFEIAKLNAFTQALIEPLSLLLAGSIFFTSIVIFDSSLGETIIICGLLYRCATQAMGCQKNLQSCLESFGSVKIINTLETDMNKILEQKSSVIDVDTINHITLKNVKLILDSFSILRDLSITLKKGEFIAFLGPSGSGKSSALRMMCGLYPFTSGKYLINGELLTHTGVQSMRSNFALLTSHSDMNIGSLTEQLTDYRYSSWKSIPENEKEFIMHNLNILYILDFINLTDIESDKISNIKIESYSNGQIQRLNLARALISRPNLLFLDEATNGLDFELEYKIYKALHSIEGLAVVAITHHSEIARCFDSVYEFKDGLVRKNIQHLGRKK
ncbi:ATP-binding cassette domain-containing protein [Alphaproteobacteria bacterium]|nr:ATP-binding cassette domain-containing protein [Alphaproteobacteria bacterium]